MYYLFITKKLLLCCILCTFFHQTVLHVGIYSKEGGNALISYMYAELYNVR